MKWKFLFFKNHLSYNANFILIDWYGYQKNVPKKQEAKILKLICFFFFRKKRFYKTPQDFTIDYPFNSKYGKIVSVLTLLSATECFAPNPIDKLMQLISLGTHIISTKLI